ncbi:MAG: sigma-70 family RNA polymerase sigma factor [Xanthomonadales bacterium]|nr:sigma-70 family RNA polymerase sigma factor [Xanthomonadales bacterium]
MDEGAQITLLLARVAEGDHDADAPLANAVVRRLERIAARELAPYQGDGALLTLEPGMLAHDALLKLLDSPRNFENRRHFFAYATQIIARALIDYQRRCNANKRGGDQARVSLSVAAEESTIDVEQVPEILDELETLDARKADLVRLRVFWGATMPEIAELLGISLATAERDWGFARRWLMARLLRDQGG